MKPCDIDFLKERYPVSYYLQAETGKTYQMSVTIHAKTNISNLFLFTGRKQLRDIVSLQAGETCHAGFTCTLTQYNLDRTSERFLINCLFLTACIKPEEQIEIQCFAQEVQAQTLYLCGDSTVTDQSCPLPYTPGTCYTSWGQSLPSYLGSDTAVDNQAHSGLTTETFRQRGDFENVTRWIKKDEFCLFQFGHNDQKLSHLLAPREYRTNLIRYIDETRSLGAVPVLVTPLARNLWKEDGTYHDLFPEYVEEIHKIGKEKQAPVIRLNELSTQFIKGLGKQAASSYFYPGDYTHTNEYGSFLFASYVAAELKRLFGQKITFKPSVPILLPPGHLWELCRHNESDADSKSGDDQSYLFHKLEMSVDNLLNAISKAKI